MLQAGQRYHPFPLPIGTPSLRGVCRRPARVNTLPFLPRPQAPRGQSSPACIALLPARALSGSNLPPSISILLFPPPRFVAL